MKVKLSPKTAIEIPVFTFDELDVDAKEKAREWYRNGALDYDWWDGVEDTIKTAGACLGIHVDRLFFSGFSSQGDGACFTGSYAYRKGWRKALRAEFGGDLLIELASIGQRLQDLQRPAFYKVYASVKHSGHYYHENCTRIDVGGMTSKTPCATSCAGVTGCWRRNTTG